MKSGLNYTEYPEDEEGVHLSFRPQKAGLITEKTPKKVLIEYANFAFFLDLASKPPKHTGINNYVIELVNANGFFRPFKLPAGTPIFFDQKSDGFFQFCVNHIGLNNLTMKTQYLLPLIDNSFTAMAISSVSYSWT